MKASRIHSVFGKFPAWQPWMRAPGSAPQQRGCPVSVYSLVFTKTKERAAKSSVYVPEAQRSQDLKG
jgi:hypothetical protein